jgi:ATP-dependent helicase HrpA
MTLDVMVSLGRILEAAQIVREQLGQLPASAVFGPAREDVARQIGRLVYPGMLTAAGLGRLTDVERYLRAAARRLERLPGHVALDRDRMAVIQDLEAQAARRSDVMWLLQELRVAQLTPGAEVRAGATVKHVRDALASPA